MKLTKTELAWLNDIVKNIHQSIIRSAQERRAFKLYLAKAIIANRP